MCNGRTYNTTVVANYVEMYQEIPDVDKLDGAVLKAKAKEAAHKARVRHIADNVMTLMEKGDDVSIADI